MIHELINNIKDYIAYLENRGIYISIHTDFAEYMLPLLDFNIHKNPMCLIIKSENSAWNRCIKEHNNEYFGQNCRCKKRICYAGVEEYVFRLECGGTLCISCEPNERTVLTPPEIKTLINPLCRMIEYLKNICPDGNIEITDNELVNRVIKFIQRNFYNKISNQDIAKVCSCSDSTICHLFKKIMGINIHKYINELRLSYAKELLKTSNLSITTIAYKCGFSDYNYFAIKFKKEIGLSPSQYRSNEKSKL